MLSTIGLIIDIVIVAALVICGIVGYKKGFLNSVLSLFSWVACVVVAVLVAKHVAGWINGIYDFSGLISSKITESLSESNEFFNIAINAEIFAGDAKNIIAAIPEETNGILAQIIKIIFSNSNVDMASSDTVAMFVGSSLGHIIMLIASGVLVFIVLMIAVALIKKFFNKISETKILGGLNKILGLVLGVIKAGVVIVIINCVLVGLTLIPAVNKTITPLVQENTNVERFIFNKTDEIFENYVIEGDNLQDWISSLWENRNTD